MISALQITGVNYEINKSTRKYAIKRIGRLDKFLPKHARKTVSASLKLSQVNHDHGNKYEVEAIMKIPGKVLKAKDSTSNMMAAIDIVEAKLLSQLQDYKEANIPHLGRRGIMSRFKRSFRREL
jgi:putative sigma-54 modulation protein